MPAARHVVLDPMTPDEFAPYLEALIVAYAQENVETGRWSAEQAVAQSRANICSLLPEGLDTTNHYLWVARDAGVPVGVLWIGREPWGASTQAYIFDLEVRAERRGQGYGRAIMAAAAEQSRQLGATSIGLHVHGPNAIARALYASLGYRETDVTMRLDL
ncbi:MAG: GNAT family N-acetyltransferase [Micromonosporaceae bacterium]